jgi:putative ABC transport system ATP-binding protein
VAAALEAHELYRFYHVGDDETFALRGVSLEVQAGEFVAIVGPSGSGKSTLISCLAGLDDPDGGWVAVAGQRITRRPQAERDRMRARYIGILLQAGNLLDHLTVQGNLEAVLHFSGRSSRSQATESALSSVGVAGRAGAYPDQLSGGELARASFAVAVVNEPAVLLLDEPTGEVDAANEAIVLQLVAERTKQGCASVIVTHSEAVASAADRVLHLVDGRLEDG